MISRALYLAQLHANGRVVIVAGVRQQMTTSGLGAIRAAAADGIGVRLGVGGLVALCFRVMCILERRVGLEGVFDY